MREYKDRTEVVSYLRNVLYGPLAGEREEIEGTPFLRYMTGMLFPVGEGVQEGETAITATADDDAKAAGDKDLEDDVPDGMELAFESLPSAVGLSFRVDDSARVMCKVRAAKYVKLPGTAAEGKKGKGRAKQKWVREPLPNGSAEEEVSLSKSSDSCNVFGG